MKHMNNLGLAAIAVMATAAIAAGNASATTLEVGGTAKNSSVEISGSLKPGTTATISFTGGSFANTCTEATGNGATTSPFTASTVSGPVSEKSVSGCDRPVTIHKPGTITVEHLTGTTNGTVRSSGAEMTVGSPIGTLTCKTGEATDMGTLTGESSGQPVMDVNAVINCGFLAPSTVLTGTMVGTGAGGFGVVS